MILTITDTPIWFDTAYRLGQQLVKEAESSPEVAYNLAGTLQLSSSGWIILSVPNALVRGIFAAMHEPGIELPPSIDGGGLLAHISVIRPEELEMIGGADKITERGKQFTYTIGRLYEIEPAGWKDMSKCWVLRIHSPALMTLRASYGLSPLPGDGESSFHVTVAVRRKAVLGRNEVAKN
jgi:hypothetical protein